MKKAIAIILIIALCLTCCLVACKDKTPSNPQSPSDPGGQQGGDSGGQQGGGSDVQMTASYLKARAEFEAVTGIQLPAIADIEVEEYPYEEGTTSYEVDITEGATNAMFDTMDALLDTALATWRKEGPSEDGGYTNIWYRADAGSIGITWDSYNTAIYVHAVMGGSAGPGEETNMTASYQAGRNSFHAISGLWMPELEGVELHEASYFNVQSKNARFIIPADDDNYAAIEQALTDGMTQYPLADNENHWAEQGFSTFWEWEYEADGRTHKVTVWAEKSSDAILVGYVLRDYYTLSVSATSGGSVRLTIAGRDQGNSAHVCYNTAATLYAEAMAGYEFLGFYEGSNCLGEETTLDYMIVKDATIEARFQEIPSNMDEGYKSVRAQLYAMSGIALPALENATVNDAHTTITPDEAGLRDEFQAQFVFATAAGAAAAFDEFVEAINLVEGEPEEEMEGMALWSLLYPDAAIPYRDDVMMHVNGTEVFLMWRKQPIVFYYVTAEGAGNAYIVYTGSDYQDHRVASYWEIADAFHGRLLAIPDEGATFEGWYVDGECVSENAAYSFNFREPVSFCMITFEARFSEAEPIEMTEGYAQARASFLAATGLTLPELAGVGGYFFAEDGMMDIGGSTPETGATQDTLAAVNRALSEQIDARPTGNAALTWIFTREIDGVAYDCELRTSFQEEGNGGLVVIVYSEQVSALPSAMTEGYAAARDGFYAITGVLLPELEEVEMLPSSDIRENQHTVACFDIPGDAITLEAIKDALIEQLGVPEDEDATGARWSIVVTAEEGYYAGWLDAMLDVEADPSAIYVNYSGGPVSASY
ncbi:MAG: hypothetical protein J5755_04305, partial [Clostridia bacterium]|nr:hypothetical protein [Clostridia bacterium]